MSIGIGIDTGGTYTDGVVYDIATGEVLAKGKSLTTKEDLSVGIGNALDILPQEMLHNATLLSLSTTLATNACVEGKGGKAKLLLVGSSRKSLEWANVAERYGLSYDEILCIPNDCSMDGSIINHPDWEQVFRDEQEWFSTADALSISATYATSNGAACEKVAKKVVGERYNVPFIMASELACELNTIERGVTALLNARLLPVIDDFMNAVSVAINKRGLNVSAMIVRSDGSLMTDSYALKHPVETILSGPAASVVGGLGLTGCKDSLIIDMGGTTTDISIVEGGKPATTGNIQVGGFRTQVKGVFIDTFGLGGDSRLQDVNSTLSISARRVLPLCIAAVRWPQIIEKLDDLVCNYRYTNIAMQEFLFLVKMPKDLGRYNNSEIKLLNLLSKEQILGFDSLDAYSKIYDRLEDEGLIMRCGLTPTDIMHIKGDFTAHNKDASILGARYFMQKLIGYEDTEQDLEKFCEEVYDAVCKKLYTNLIRAMLCYKYPRVFSESFPEQLIKLIELSWLEGVSGETQFFGLSFDSIATLVGIGAPTHIFIKKVAEVMGVDFVIPKHSEVANALGAIIADISAGVSVKIVPNYTDGGLFGYRVQSMDEHRMCDDLEQAYEVAESMAVTLAEALVKERGLAIKPTIHVEKRNRYANATDGAEVHIESAVIATAFGKNEGKSIYDN